MARTTTLYIFDMGDVVSVNNQVIPEISRSVGISAHGFVETAHQDALSLMAGSISEHEFWGRVSDALGRKLPDDLFARFFHPSLNREVVELVCRLGRTGSAHGPRPLRRVVGTNTIPSHYRIHLAAGHYDLFDAVYPSHQLGVIKPAPAFYRAILEREDRTPGETVFIDDLAENVEAARCIGIRAIRFTSAADLAAQLSLDD